MTVVRKNKSFVTSVKFVAKDSGRKTNSDLQMLHNNLAQLEQKPKLSTRHNSKRRSKIREFLLTRNEIA